MIKFLIAVLYSSDPHAKFFVPAPKLASSIQETSDEGSVQFDSSSEESRVRFVIKITPSRWDRSSAISVEVSTWSHLVGTLRVFHRK